MSSIDGMLILMAKMAPKELLVQQLEIAVKDFQEGKLLNKPETEMDELFNNLTVPCLLVLTKRAGSDDPFKMMEEMDKINKARNLLRTNEG